MPPALKAKATAAKKGKSRAPTMDAVNEASLLYANTLNARPLTPVLRSILASSQLSEAQGFVAAPYVYFNRNGIDYEDEDEGYDMVGSLYEGQQGEDDLINLDSVDQPEVRKKLATDVAQSYKQILSYNEIGTKYKKFVGLMGIKIHNVDGGVFTPVGDHYVAYIYDNGRLSFFDSGAPGLCSTQLEDNNTFIILKSVMSEFARESGVRLTTTCNTGTFETAAGVSEDPKNYVGQNIFCHSWSMWFIYQRLVLGRTMKQVDSMSVAPTQNEMDRQNLLRIKSFIMTYLIPTAGLSGLYCDDAFLPFTYYIHNPEVKPRARNKPKRTTMPIPGFSLN